MNHRTGSLRQSRSGKPIATIAACRKETTQPKESQNKQPSPPPWENAQTRDQIAQALSNAGSTRPKRIPKKKTQTPLLVVLGVV